MKVVLMEICYVYIYIYIFEHTDPARIFDAQGQFTGTFGETFVLVLPISTDLSPSDDAPQKELSPTVPGEINLGLPICGGPAHEQNVKTNTILWMDEILHHLETMGNHCLLVCTG